MTTTPTTLPDQVQQQARAITAAVYAELNKHPAHPTLVMGVLLGMYRGLAAALPEHGPNAVNALCTAAVDLQRDLDARAQAHPINSHLN